MIQRVVISGLADGMGRRTALLLADQGMSIAGFDVDEAGLASLREELDAKGTDHHLVPLDIRDRAGVRAFRDEVLEKWGYVDTVVSNVGVPFFGPFEEVDLDAALRAFEINVIGAAALFQSFLPGMRERRRGKLVAVASLVGRIPFPFESIYSSTKFAVEGMVQSLKFEVEPYGIRVALIEPAQVATGFAQKALKRPEKTSPYYERAMRFIKRDTELVQKAPTPEQAATRIAAVVLADKPKLFNQVDTMSSLFFFLNQHLPTRVRDAILLNHMGIRDR
ncbi:SDR family NAD(P)-dependent oxidoreductase [Streptomyces sp. RY43-2]|uniref:SDR family NAD(P)-dependent oxidoreductase n=1 Tax=Streptomyces macrolidinus TaxID=2952607 RepID=A0ABT0ZFL6_9ACTN|nr:SDR family NAD(P)-dependent oxidoreductase [Streptomyces macrolidinus]MCN9242357.1 SDR family NAD(P)-dependent oxidoreductase [Streptomyces macrolidinus]